jgi:hypothetical protein
MNFEALRENFKQLNEQMEAARKEMQSKSTGFIEAACENFFECCPDVDSVFWTQYTPYFNDGESCTFSVGDIYFTLSDDAGMDDYEGSYLYSEDDLRIAENNLKIAQEYQSNPTAWVDSYKADYRKRYGKDYPTYAYSNSPKPSYSVDEATENVQNIQSFLEKYGANTISTINIQFDSLCGSIKMVDDEIMQAVYGDHVRVRITRSGTEIEHYSHE